MSHRSSRSYYDSSSAGSGGHDGRNRHRERSRSPQAHRRAARSNHSPERGGHYGSSSNSSDNHHHHHHHHNSSSDHHWDNPRYSRYHDNDDYRPDVRCFSPSPPFFCVVWANSSFCTGGALLWYSITSWEPNTDTHTHIHKTIKTSLESNHIPPTYYTRAADVTLIALFIMMILVTIIILLILNVLKIKVQPNPISMWSWEAFLIKPRSKM